MACKYHDESGSHIWGYCTKDSTPKPVSKERWYSYCKDNWENCDKYNERNEVCIITRALCGYRGLRDQGYIMTIIRDYRDKQMSTADTVNYYSVSADITAKLDTMEKDEQRSILEYIWRQIRKAVDYLRTGRDDDAYAVYVKCLEETARRVGV